MTARRERPLRDGVIGIDARLAVSRGRGWGRYAGEMLTALADSSDSRQYRVLLPDSPSARELGAALDQRARASSRKRGWFAVYAPFRLGEGEAYLDGVLDAEDPVQHLGPVDVLHSLTRFAVSTAAPRVVATVHDIAPLADPPCKLETAAMTRRAIAGLRAMNASVIAVSEATRRDLVERAKFDEDSIRVVPPGVSDRFFCDEGRAVGMPRVADETELLCVGGAGPNKNLVRLVEAVAMLRESRRVRLTLVGSEAWGYDRLREDLARRMRWAEAPSWLRHLGHVTDERLRELYRQSLVVMPSLHEGFGLPIVEAMACGATVACSDIPVFREVAGDAAFRFDPYDPDAIAGVLDEALSDDTHRARLAKRGRRRVERFRWPFVVERVKSEYRSCFAPRGTRASSLHDGRKRDASTAKKQGNFDDATWIKRITS